MESVLLSPANVFQLIWLSVIANLLGRVIHRFILESNSFLRSLFPLFPNASGNAKIPPSEHDNDDDDDDEDDCVHGHAVAMLMEKMGLTCDPAEGGETTINKVGSGEISRIFEEEEPSIQELKAAFDVFDENSDGFIDAFELKRVIEILGLGKGCDLDACKRMIRTFDENGDGRIDSDEFFGFMRRTLC